MPNRCTPHAVMPNERKCDDAGGHGSPVRRTRSGSSMLRTVTMTAMVHLQFATLRASTLAHATSKPRTSAMPVPPDVLAALQKMDSATLANAIEPFKVRDRTTGYANAELACQFPQAAPMVGYAVTCVGDTTMPGDSRPSGVAQLVDLVDAAPKPAVIVIQAAGHEQARMCYLGDMFTATMSKLGAVGVVTNGNCRDRSGIMRRTPGFHLFSRGWVVSHGYGVYYNFNTTVTVAGLTIEPGDLLHGDESGVLKVPTDIAEGAVATGKKLLAFEEEYFQFLESDQFDMEEMKRRFAPP